MANDTHGDNDVELKADEIDRLPFVTMPAGGPRIFWAPPPTGDYNFDCTLGVQYAEATLALLRDAPAGMPCLWAMLRLIVLDMLKHGNADRDRGVIVGMMGRLGQVMEAGVRRSA